MCCSEPSASSFITMAGGRAPAPAAGGKRRLMTFGRIHETIFLIGMTMAEAGGTSSAASGVIILATWREHVMKRNSKKAQDSCSTSEG